jgi:hypothetical protein
LTDRRANPLFLQLVDELSISPADDIRHSQPRTTEVPFSE